MLPYNQEEDLTRSLLDQVLGQDKSFLSLHWFESVSSHFTAKKAELLDQGSAGKSGLSDWFGKLRGSQQSDSQSQNRDLAVARLDSYASEFRLLNDILSCAQLLFQAQ